MEQSMLLYALSVVCLIYVYIKWNYLYWQRIGLSYLEPIYLFGNIKEFVLGKKTFGKQFEDIYKEIKSKGWRHAGIYEFLEPCYFPIDLELVKSILVKDFWHFPNHDGYVNERDDLLTGNLFSLEDDKWKNLRAKLSPTFTLGKIKAMFSTLLACSPSLVELLKDHATRREPIDIKSVVSRFTTDVIGSCAFGIDCNSLKNPNSDFLYYGKKAFSFEGFHKLRIIMTMFIPRWILVKLRFKETDSSIEEFYTNLVKTTIHYRENNNVQRKDFMNMLIEMKNKGIEIAEGGSTVVKYLTENEIIAQCFVFFLAGFETSATTMNFALYELAVNQNVQNKLRNEIKTVLTKYNGELTYDAIQEMTYLDNIVHETLRRYPPGPFTSRVCTKSYKIPDSKIVLEPGTKVIIPIQGIHMDPEYYPEPEKFNPDRFKEEIKSRRPPCSFLPFGEGPRICIGAKFGLLEVKLGLCVLIDKLKFTLNNKTKTPLKYSMKSIITTVEGGIWLNVHEIQ